jgi:ABC-type dipeptide/oligopeptide/nickel transport system ATPase component
MSMKELLRIENLRLYFDTEEGTVKALEDVNLSVKEGEIVGVVGETGSGKSITAMSILKLIPTPPARMLSGKIWFDNQEISSFDEEKMREIRGKKIAMIFQEPHDLAESHFHRWRATLRRAHDSRED